MIGFSDDDVAQWRTVFCTGVGNVQDTVPCRKRFEIANAASELKKTFRSDVTKGIGLHACATFTCPTCGTKTDVFDVPDEVMAQLKSEHQTA